MSDDKPDARKEFISKSYSIEESYQEQRSCNHAQRFGLCGRCSRFGFAETEFSVVVARCHIFEVDLTSKEPITNCSGYEEKGKLSLQDMGNVAYMIESKPKDKIGFGK